MGMARSNPALDNPHALAASGFQLSVFTTEYCRLFTSNTSNSIDCLPSELPTVVGLPGPNLPSLQPVLIFAMIFSEGGSHFLWIVWFDQEVEVASQKFTIPEYPWRKLLGNEVQVSEKFN